MKFWGRKISDIPKPYTVEIGGVLSLKFETLEHAYNFADGFNFGRSQHGARMQDAQQFDLKDLFKNRGFRFSWFFKQHLERHDLVHRWSKCRANVLTSIKRGGNGLNELNTLGS
jgi:hypothetical protein